MNYLIFDIECCDGEHICEFGYVLFDEQFNIIKRECITIDPNHKFKLTGRKHAKDIQLYFSEEVYYNSPNYDIVYDQIKQTIQTPDCRIIGFSMKDDAKFLATANELYGKQAIEFSYIDFQVLYQAYTKAKQKNSIERIVNQLGIEGITLHKSDDDSYAVMCFLREICKRENLSLPETIEYLKKCKGNYKEERAKTHNLSLIKKINGGNKKAQNEFLNNFISRLKRNEDSTHEFNNKAVSIDMKFQKEHFNEFLSLIEELYKVGAIYTGKSSECDVFIQTHSEEDPRTVCANSAAQQGRYISFITLNDILDKLGIKLKDLSKNDYTNSYLKKEKSRFYCESKEVTVGEVLKSKGYQY